MPEGSVVTEADTCRKFVVPRLQTAGWEGAPHPINEQRTFTDGRVIFVGGKAKRGRQKRADYILRYSADYPIAIVEAKAAYKSAADGLQQAKDYAEILGLKFAYATNGAEILEFDFLTGLETLCHDFPTPAELWSRQRAGLGLTDDTAAERLLAPGFPDPTKPPFEGGGCLVGERAPFGAHRDERILTMFGYVAGTV
jgi:type I restriction enzyme R subunit